MFVVLAPFDNEQSDLTHRINEESQLAKLPLFKYVSIFESVYQFEQLFNREFLKCFISTELIRWPKIEEIYGAALKSSSVFDPLTEGGQKRYKTLHKRVIEHVSCLVFRYGCCTI
jgi:26S proteasome regulatory subunit N5